MSASVGHGRLVLLQAAAALLVGLAQQPKSRQQLLQPGVSEALVNLALQVGMQRKRVEEEGQVGLPLHHAAYVLPFPDH